MTDSLHPDEHRGHKKQDSGMIQLHEQPTLSTTGRGRATIRRNDPVVDTVVITARMDPGAGLRHRVGS